MQLAEAAQMRELDRQTIEELGLPGMVLMENAGRGTVQHMVRCFGPVQDKTICVFAGPGNNGGDGSVIARTVYGMGAHPFVFFLSDPERLKGDAATNFQLIKKLRLPYQVLDGADQMFTLVDTVLTLHRLHPLHSVVDAIFGTGLGREVTGLYQEAVNCINHLREHDQIPVVSVDVPSGLNTDTGAVLGVAVRADLTVTYGLPKPVHYHHGGSGVGHVECVDIGIPPKLVEQMHLMGTVLDSSMSQILPSRQVAAHKGANGHLLILAGSTGKTGAALLSAQGALRCGAGLVTLAVPGNLNPIFETALAEAMTVPLQASQSSLSIDDLEVIKDLAANKNALVIGPGIGTGTKTAELVCTLYQSITSPMVLDADALNILAARPEILDKAAGPRIFTPHPGEMARLRSSSIAEIQADRIRTAQWLNSQNPALPLVTVLKGAGTVVAANDGRWAINTSGNPGMGTGGMGDVLSGIIGSLLVQGLGPWEAATLGVYLHGRAADSLAETEPFGYTATEVAQALPRVLGLLIKSHNKELLC